MDVRSVFHVTREFAGLAEAGGVKDAVAGLVGALVRLGIKTSVALPLYGFMRDSLDPGPIVAEFVLGVPDQDNGNRLRNEPVRVHSLEKEGAHFFLVDSPRFAEKGDVYTYTAAEEESNPQKKRGTGHWDFHQMNLILQKSAIEAARGAGKAPDVFHCHDGHAAFLPALLRECSGMENFAGSGALVTIHNAGVGYHQEIWDMAFAEAVTGLARKVLSRGILNATVDPLLLSGFYAHMSTVSEQYAKELLAEKESEISGGLGRLFREAGIGVSGVTNGVDPACFDPRHPENSGVPFEFDPGAGDWSGKRKCKLALLSELGFPAGNSARPLFGFIGRLTQQKGIDILHAALSELLRRGCEANFVVLGQGMTEDESRFHELSRGVGGMVFIPKYDPGLSKRIYAGTDFLLIPSEFEPCGLTDFHAQLMASIPVVHRVGGLVKVRDEETGFCYAQQHPDELAAVIRKCVDAYLRKPDAMEVIRKRAFAEIFLYHTWDTVARDGYLPLYAAACGRGR
jgi:starch synthase